MIQFNYIVFETLLTS